MPATTATETIQGAYGAIAAHGAGADATAGRRRGPAQQARLLAGLSSDGRPVPLPAHRNHYPVPPAPGRAARDELIALVAQAGLVGRGGASFPAATKMRSVAAASGRAVVVANGTEGEPNSAKDRLLLSALPHLVLDGAMWAAAATGADRVIVCIDRTNRIALDAVRHAVAERQQAEPVGIIAEIADTPPRYVAGESSALVHWVNGGPAKPTSAPPRPHQRGVDGRPTLVHNVETLAHLTQICTAGPRWFRQVGTPEEPGSTLLTVAGAVVRPSVVEAPVGTPLGQILNLAGGPSEPLQALMVGGFFGAWVPARAGLDAAFSQAGLRPLGAAPGSGTIVALPASACGLVETARVLAWFAAESAGQCGPCIYGLADLASGAATVASGHGGAPDVAQLRRWADQIDGRGGCHHPHGAVQLLRSAIAVFGDDLERHLGGWTCAGASAPPVVPIAPSTPIWR